MRKKFICVFSEEDKQKLLNKGMKIIDKQIINGHTYFYFLNDKKKYEQFDLDNMKYLYTDCLFI